MKKLVALITVAHEIRGREQVTYERLALNKACVQKLGESTVESGQKERNCWKTGTVER